MRRLGTPHFFMGILQMVVGVATIRIIIHQSFSLKEKRQVVKSILGKVRAKFDISIAEVGDHDKWQSSVLAAAVVSNESGHAHSMLESIHSFIEDLRIVEIAAFNTELIQFGGL